MAVPITSFYGVEIKDWTFNGVALEEAYMNGVLVFKKTLVINIGNHYTNATDGGGYRFIYLANLIKERRHNNETNVVVNIVSGAEVPCINVGAVSGVTSLIINNHGIVSGGSPNDYGMKANTAFTLYNYGTIRSGGKNGATGGKGATGHKGADDHQNILHQQNNAYAPSNCVIGGKNCNEGSHGVRFIWNGHTTGNISSSFRHKWVHIPGVSHKYEFHFGDFVKNINCGSGGARECKISERHYESKIRRGGAGGTGGNGGAGGTGQYYLHASTAGHVGATGGAGHASSPSGGHSGARGVTGHTGEHGGNWGAGISLENANRIHVALKGTLIGRIVNA